MLDFYERYWKEKKTDTLDDYYYKWPVIKQVIPQLRDGTILDYGCGAGVVLQKLVTLRPDNNFIGVDISKEAIKRAVNKLPNIKFSITRDNKLLQMSTSVDLITCMDVIEHVYDTKQLIKEFARVLRRGGKIIITTPYHGLLKNLVICLFGFDTVFDPTGPHIRFFTVKSMAKLLTESGLEIEQVGYFGRFFPIWRGFYVIARKG